MNDDKLSPAALIGLFAIVIAIILTNQAIRAIFTKSGRVDRKRRIYLALCVINVILASAFLALLGVPAYVLPIITAFLAFGFYRYSRGIRFCESCSLGIMTIEGFADPSYCPHCGAKIEK